MRLLVLLVAVYAGLCLVLVLTKNRIVFPITGGTAGDPSRFGGEAVAIPVDGGDTLGAWFIPAGVSPSPVMVWFHGNGETVAGIAPVLREFRQPGVALLAVDYRGYGVSTGRATVANVEADVLPVWDWLAARGDVDMARVVVYGRSIGSGPAAALAAQRPVAGLVLESAFTSLGDMAREAYPIFPKFLAGSGFNNRRNLLAATCPVLFIHGDSDNIIPTRMGRALAEALGARAELWLIPGANHNDSYDAGGEEYVRRVQAFVSKVVERQM